MFQLTITNCQTGDKSVSIIREPGHAVKVANVIRPMETSEYASLVDAAHQKFVYEPKGKFAFGITGLNFKVEWVE